LFILRKSQPRGWLSVGIQCEAQSACITICNVQMLYWLNAARNARGYSVFRSLPTVMSESLVR